MQRIVQSVEKVNNDSLKNLLSQLRPEVNPKQQYDRKKSIMEAVDEIENKEYLELVERFAKKLAGKGVA